MTRRALLMTENFQGRKLMTDVGALAKSLRRLAHVSGDAGDETTY